MIGISIILNKENGQSLKCDLHLSCFLLLLPMSSASLYIFKTPQLSLKTEELINKKKIKNK